jgi:exopolysaccharide biosynthesis predicted pyruvyltransferase EpsI
MTRIPECVLRLPRNPSNRYFIVMIEFFFHHQLISMTTVIQHALKSADIMLRFQLDNVPCHREERPTTCTALKCLRKQDEMDNPQKRSEDLESYVYCLKCSECNL